MSRSTANSGIGIPGLMGLAAELFLSRRATAGTIANGPPSPRLHHNVVLAESIDWSKMPGFPAVADEMYNFSCGCCWAVVAAKSIEAYYAILTGLSAQNLSIMQIVDCAACEGCLGGTLNKAYNYVAVAGLTTESSYPGPPGKRDTWYGIWIGYCKMTPDMPISVRISGYERIEPNELQLMRALQQGPVGVCCNVNKDFSRLVGVVLEVEDCPPRAVKEGERHVLLVVGYDKDFQGKPIWKLMDTWGPEYHNDGYVEFRRGCADPRGVCGMFEHSGFRPVLKL